jgi:hypothetical protein
MVTLPSALLPELPVPATWPLLGLAAAARAGKSPVQVKSSAALTLERVVILIKKQAL